MQWANLRLNSNIMEEDTKKVSFSFKQVSSRPKIVPAVQKPIPEKAVQYIDCVEEKSIRLVGPEVENNDRELVIPMQPSAKRRLPVEPLKSKQNGVENAPHENGGRTLDEIAVQAILLDCQKTGEGDGEEESTETIEMPMIVNPPEGKEVSTAEDYENVPVSKFGMAMLRGMGWESTKDAQQIVSSRMPELRPKGMGLGADKLIKSAKEKRHSEVELKLKNGSYVQFVIGRLNGQYGQVQGFDEGAGRVVIKIARTNQMEKVSENTFRLVTKSDYDTNSRVINIKEYKEYHEGKTRSDDSEGQEARNGKKSVLDIHCDQRSHHKTKKSKHSKSPHRKHKSDHNRHKKYKRKRSSS